MTFEPTSLIAKGLAAFAFRNSHLEYLHSGKRCPTCAGDPTFSRISDDEMRSLMIDVVNRTYWALKVKKENPSLFQAFIVYEATTYAQDWNDPEVTPKLRELEQSFKEEVRRLDASP